MAAVWLMFPGMRSTSKAQSQVPEHNCSTRIWMESEGVEAWGITMTRMTKIKRTTVVPNTARSIVIAVLTILAIANTIPKSASKV